MNDFDMAHAALLASTMRRALTEGRWSTCRWTESFVARLEGVLALPVEDVEQEAVKTGYVFVAASNLFVQAQGSWLDGSLRATAEDDRLLSPHRKRLAAAPTNIVEVDFDRRTPITLPRAA